MKYILIILLFVACNNQIEQNKAVEEIQTAKAGTGKPCNLVCDAIKNPDLRLITNATQNPPSDNIVDTNTYFWKTYHVRTFPITIQDSFLVSGLYTIRYGWDSGVLVNRVRLQCLVENIAPFGCGNDWVFSESQGYPVGSNIYFDGLFSFDTYEKGKGNSWKFLYTDFKKEFFPSCVPTQEYVYETGFCYYDRAVQAQMGDFYYNYFRFPNKDGIYRLIIKFNPVIKGCRAVVETNYENNEETVELEIKEGKVNILKTTP